MHEKVFCGIRKHLNVWAETQGFAAIGLEPVGACHVVKHTLRASSPTL